MVKMKSICDKEYFYEFVFITHVQRKESVILSICQQKLSKQKHKNKNVSEKQNKIKQETGEY